MEEQFSITLYPANTPDRLEMKAEAFYVLVCCKLSIV